jgi:glycine/D-amino acid oxidase-like deaminating enzyme
MWEADVPLSELAHRIGEDAAVARWRRVADTVARLAGKIDRDGLDGERRDCPSLYLSGDRLDADGLQAEAALRRKYGLPSNFLDAATVADRFGIAPRPALLSGGSFEVDPVGLTLDLLTAARRNGATLTWPCDALGVAQRADDVALVTDCGTLHAGHVVLAGGYERAPLYLPPDFELISSYAIATDPGVAPLWREPAMIWEASGRYLYARADRQGRVIAGGGDAEMVEAPARDRLIAERTARIARDLTDLTGHAVQPRERWAATFGASPDGLPAIGRARPGERVWLASGFGGNGISFAALAAELLTAELVGAPDPDLALFDPYRFTRDKPAASSPARSPARAA